MTDAVRLREGLAGEAAAAAAADRLAGSARRRRTGARAWAALMTCAPPAPEDRPPVCRAHWQAVQRGTEEASRGCASFGFGFGCAGSLEAEAPAMLAAPLPSPSAQSTRSLCVGPDWRLSLGGTCAAQRPAVRCARPAGRPARGGVCWAPFSGWPRSAACPGVTPRRDQERGSPPPPPLPGRSGLERALLWRACALVLVYSRALATSYACALLPACRWPTTICLAR
mmetsp:Transcript_20758/g.79619  ORF Transcript_20758/g.79619 Transcript_20758/m.79619 type:complete len:226 (+) Transcript_20758:239-916(+)